jgi:hypothetical protein
MSTVHDGARIQQNYDAYLVGSELCGVCCVLWCVQVRVPGPRSGIRELGSNASQNIRYFFIIGRIKRGDIQVIYKPTLEMMVDIMTKPLTGNLFRKLRDLLRNVT